jgi:hypothetical protein
MGWWWEVAEGEKLRAERDAGRAWCGSRRAEIVFPELQDHTRHADTPRCAFATEKLGGHACLALTVLLEAQHERRRSSCLIGPDPETWLGSVIDITPACKARHAKSGRSGGISAPKLPLSPPKIPIPTLLEPVALATSSVCRFWKRGISTRKLKSLAPSLRLWHVLAVEAGQGSRRKRLPPLSSPAENN